MVVPAVARWVPLFCWTLLYPSRLPFPLRLRWLRLVGGSIPWLLCGSGGGDRLLAPPNRTVDRDLELTEADTDADSDAM